MSAPVVVVADDEPHILRLLSIVMERSGFEVVAVADGRAAVDAVLERRPRLVLLDGEMPVLNGYDACREIRAAGLEPAPQVWMVTTAGRATDERNARDAGVDEFLTKPFSPSDIGARARAVADGA